MHLCRSGLHQISDAAGMICVVVCDQDVLQRDPWMVVKPGKHLMGAARVNHQGVPIIVQQPDVVVSKCG